MNRYQFCPYAVGGGNKAYVCSLSEGCKEFCCFQRYCANERIYKQTNGAVTCVRKTAKEKENN